MDYFGRDIAIHWDVTGRKSLYKMFSARNVANEDVTTAERVVGRRAVMGEEQIVRTSSSLRQRAMDDCRVRFPGRGGRGDLKWILVEYAPGAVDRLGGGMRAVVV